MSIRVNPCQSPQKKSAGNGWGHPRCGRTEPLEGDQHSRQGSQQKLNGRSSVVKWVVDICEDHCFFLYKKNIPNLLWKIWDILK